MIVPSLFGPGMTYRNERALEMKSILCVCASVENERRKRALNERMWKLMHSIGRAITDAQLICENKTHPDAIQCFGSSQALHAARVR